MGFEPMHEGFADLSLTTWVRRRINKPTITYFSHLCKEPKR